MCARIKPFLMSTKAQPLYHCIDIEVKFNMNNYVLVYLVIYNNKQDINIYIYIIAQFCFKWYYCKHRQKRKRERQKIVLTGFELKSSLIFPKRSGDAKSTDTLKWTYTLITHSKSDFTNHNTNTLVRVKYLLWSVNVSICLGAKLLQALNKDLNQPESLNTFYSGQILS